MVWLQVGRRYAVHARPELDAVLPKCLACTQLHIIRIAPMSSTEHLRSTSLLWGFWLPSNNRVRREYNTVTRQRRGYLLVATKYGFDVKRAAKLACMARNHALIQQRHLTSPLSTEARFLKSDPVDISTLERSKGSEAIRKRLFSHCSPKEKVQVSIDPCHLKTPSRPFSNLHRSTKISSGLLGSHEGPST